MSDGVLSGSWRSRLCHRNHVDRLHCSRCGEEIQVGDRVHTTAGVGRSLSGLRNDKKVRVYHARAC